MSIKTCKRSFLKRFTNFALFEKRENNRLELKMHKTMYPLKLYKNKKNKKEKEENETNNDLKHILFSFYSFQSEGNPNFKTYTVKKNHRINTNSLFTKNSYNFSDTSFPFYLTETEQNSFKKSKNSGISKSRNYISIKISNNNNNMNNNLTLSNKYKSFSNFNKNKTKIQNINKEEIVDFKKDALKSIHKDNNYNAKSYIDKIRKLLKIKYSCSIKNERKQIKEEILDNEKEIIDDKIKSLNNVKGLYNQYFSSKLSEYIKFIFKQRELERKYDTELKNQIYSLKIEISRLINKIKKLEVEKFSIIQWLFFQIKVKEKKLVLPNYFARILETSMKRNNVRKATHANIKIISQPSKKMKSNVEKINFGQNNEQNFSGVEQDEIKRILKYKKSLVFETPNDFFDELKKIENKNIKLFSQGDVLYSEIKKLKGQYDIIISEKMKNDSSIFNKIKNKEIELEETKKRYKIQIKILNEFKNKKNKNAKNKKVNTQPNKKKDFFNKNELSLNPKKLHLFTIIKQLYRTCQDIDIKKINGRDDDLESQISIKNLKANKTKEEEILDMMEFIEVRISHLLNIFSIYKNPFNPNYELIRRLKNNLIRKRKIEKAELTRIENDINYRKIIQQLDSRSNKLVFLQRRKIGMKNYSEWNNKQKKDNILKSKQVYVPTFEDFLFDNE
jgi:hypothetical protein